MIKKTDLDNYYKKPYFFSRFSRKITSNLLLKLMKKYLKNNNSLEIIELGGGNSCVFALIENEFKPQKYIIIDNNQISLDKFIENNSKRDNVLLINKDILNVEKNFSSDLVLSIGLIEHFDENNTKNVIINHFNNVKENGLIIMSFPTPTFLYKITRKISQLLGLWIFHDERPLKMKEVLDTAKNYGEILECKIVWPIFLTQGFVVIKKI